MYTNKLRTINIGAYYEDSNSDRYITIIVVYTIDEQTKTKSLSDRERTFNEIDYFQRPLCLRIPPALLIHLHKFRA